jgi:hypothetical protein
VTPDAFKTGFRRTAASGIPAAGLAAGEATTSQRHAISGLSALSFTYAETMPPNSGTTAQAAWDIWLSNDAGFPNEVMVWVDNVNRGDGGATQKASASFGGQDWTLYQNGGGELIWSLDAPGTFALQGSGTVDLLALLRWLQNNGHAAAGASIGEIDFGWEICSTGGVRETFTVSNYDLKSSLWPVG